MNTFVEEKRKAVISGLSNIEKTATKMTKLEACKRIQKELRSKDIGRQELESVNEWNAYKRMAAFIKSEGDKKGISPKKMEALARIAGLELELTIDYDLS